MSVSKSIILQMIYISQLFIKSGRKAVISSDVTATYLSSQNPFQVMRDTFGEARMNL